MNGSEGKKRRRPAEWLALRLDVPPDLFEGGLRVELRGREAVTVHGITRIAHYAPRMLVLTLKEGHLTLRGERLIVTTYLGGAVVVNGRVDSLTFGDGDGTDEADGGGEGIFPGDVPADAGGWEEIK